MSSHRFPVSLLLSSGRFALPVASGLSCVVLAAHCRYAVGGEGIISSSLAPLVRYEERGAGWPVLAEVDSVIMSAWRVIIPPCSRRGDGSRAVCFAIGFPIAFVSFLVPCGCSFRFYSLFATSCDTTGGELVSCLAAFVLGWVVARSRCLPCGYCLALPCLPRASRAVFPPASLAGLFAIRSVRSALSSYRLAPRSSDKWGGANVACVSVFVRLGRCRLLLVVAGPWMWRGGSPSWVLLFTAVSMASAGGVISVVPVACRVPFYRSGVSRSPLLLASPSLSSWAVG